MSTGPIEGAIRLHEYDVSLAQWMTWRVGRKVGRTIYAQLGDLPSDDDQLIGTMDTEMLAEEAVRAHNASLRSVDR
jgi:hypothetical protein